MRYGRVNASYRCFPESMTTVQFDYEVKDGLTIASWLVFLEDKLRELLEDPEGWYLSYFVVMDVKK